MKILYHLMIAISVMTFTLQAGGQTIIAQWDFEDQDATVDLFTPENFNQFISRENTPGIVTSYPSGNPGYAISTDSWVNGTGIKYWMVEVNTSYTSNLVVKWNQYSDATGPRDFRLQYRIGAAGIWAPAIGNDITLPNSAWTNNTIALPPLCGNQASVFIRWIMRSDQAAGGGLVTSTGHNLMDNISISGNHDYSCFTYGYLKYYTCGANYTFPTAASGGLTSPPPGTPGAPNYGPCWQNVNSGNRALWLVFKPTVSGLWTFVFTPTTGNVNAWIWGGYTSLPNSCADLQNLIDCNNGTGGSPISISGNVVAGLYYVTLVTNPTGTNSFVTITNTGVADIVPPIVFDAEHCGAASLTLRLSGATTYETYKWYDAQVGGTLLKQSADNLDSTFVTPFLTTSQTYWVTKVYVIPGTPMDSCVSDRTPIRAIIDTFPVAPVSILADRPVLCTNDTGLISLTAVGGSGTTLRWFTGSCGGTEIGTGNPLVISAPLVTTTYYARWENSCGTSGCTGITLDVQVPVTAGSIMSDQTICGGTNPVAITNVISGSGSGIITYRWESYAGTGPWTIINGASGDSYLPPAGLMTTTSYRRITISTLGGISCESQPTNTVTVTVNIVTPGIVGNDQIVCIGSDPAGFTELVGATGSGVPSYQWQSSATGCGGTWTDIPGANSSTYNPLGLVLPTCFRRVVIYSLNGVNCSAISNCITINVISLSATITGTNVPCYGDNNGTAFVTVTGGIGGYTYQWDDPQAQTTNPAINLAPGTYTVLVTDGGSLCTITRSITIIQIYPTPSASISVMTGERICRGDSITLSFDLTGTPPWTLTYSDGFISTTVTGIMSSPYVTEVVPTQSCTYIVTSLIDAFCTAVPGMIAGSAAVIVHQPPAVEYTWETTQNNNEIQFHIDSTITDLGAIGYMVLWNFGDGTFGYGHNPLHQYPGSNAYNCTLTVTDTNGCENSITHLVNVPVTPQAFFSATTPVCKGQQVCFTDLSFVPSPPFGYIQTWIWNYGDGSPNDTIHFPQNPNRCHLYTVENTFSVTLTIIANDGYRDDYTGDVVIIPNPIAAFTLSTDCEDQPVQFTDASNPNGGDTIISWNWNFGDPTSGINNTSTLQNPVHTFTSGNTTFSVSLIVQNFNLCGDTIVNPVYIHSKPLAEFTRDSACIGEVVHFVADGGVMQIDSIVTWTWDFGDGSVPSHDPGSAQHTYVAFGTYITTLTVTDHHGCFNSVAHGVRVNPLPVPVFSWSTPACSGNPVQFTDNSTVPAGYTGYIAKWLWEFGDGTSQLVVLPNSPNVSHTFAGNGMTHTVRLTVWTNDSCSQFVEHVIETLASPFADFSTSVVTCQDQPVQFTDLTNTNGGGAILTWNWNFGDPTSGLNNTSGLQNPAHTYLASGTYTVTLVVTNLSGCTDTIIKNIIISASPVSDFLANTVCLHNPTQFTDNSIANANAILTYTWDFGDGSAVSHLQNPTHVYSISGTFNVTLTIVNSNGCSGDITKPVIVNPLPIAAFSYSAPGCLGGPVQYTDLSTTPAGYLGSIVRWVWGFGDGTTTTILAPANPNVSHTFAGTALSHVVRLTVTTSDSCTSFIEHTVNSITSPIADFGFPAMNCNTQSVQFSDLSSANGGGGIVSWNWNFGDPVSGTSNNSTDQNPVHLFSGPGNYSILLIILNTSGCSDTVLKTITILSSPVANFISDTACLNQPSHFTDQSTANSSGIISYSWDFGDGSPGSNQQNPTHTYSSYGIKNVKLTITNSNGCIKDTTRPVLVRPLPIAAFTFSSGNCTGVPVQFTDNSTTLAGYPGTIIQWEWNFGDGTPPVIIPFPNNPNVSHTFNGTSTVYIVRLTVTTSDGCNDLIEHIVITMASPAANFSNPSRNCQLQPVQFTDLSQSNGGGIIQWNWNFGDPVSGGNNTSTLQHPSHIFSGPGTYSVMEIIFNSSGCSDTATHSILVLPSPVANFTADTACFGSATIFTNQSTNSAGPITQYLWDFGDGTTSTAPNPVHTYLSYGIFQVMLTVTTQDGCSSDTTKEVRVLPPAVALFSASGPTCLGDSVDFTDNSFAMFGSIHMWQWDFGDGVVITIIDPSSPNVNHLYTNSGTYNVALKIFTTFGCTATTSMLVQIQPAPVADYSYSTSRCEMKPVQFTDMSKQNGGSPIIQWLWDFGDPGSGAFNNSPLPNPVHTFSGSGTYNVVLQVTSQGGCIDSITKPVSINPEPLAQFTYDSACATFATQFTDQSIANAQAISSWYWIFGDPMSGTNNFSTSQNPSHIYSNTGSYLVTLRVINSNGCEKDTVIIISVPSSPVALFQYSPSCVGMPTQFTDLSNAPNSQLSSWFWDFGDGNGTSNLQNPIYTYTGSGTYNVKLRVMNLSGCTDSIIIPVISRPTPVAAYSYTNFFCPAGKVNFQDHSQANGTNIAEWLWIFEPGSTSTSHDPVYVFPVTDTTYLVSLIVTDGFGCSDTITQGVYVKPAFSFTFTNDMGCTDHPVQFHAQNNNPTDSLYLIQWNFGDPASGGNNTSTLHDPTHIFSSPRTYIVKMKAWNSDNCVDSVYRTVLVPALPAPGYSFVSPSCDSLTLFTDESTAGDGTIASWSWNFGDGSPVHNLYPPNSGNTTHSFTYPGTYAVTLEVTNSLGCTEKISKLVERPACIISSFMQSDPGSCSNSPVKFTDNSMPVGRIDEWHWDFGDGSDTVYNGYTSTINHTYTVPGSYNVVLRISAYVNGQSFKDSAMRQVSIKPSPAAAFSTSSSCLDKVTTFYDQSNTFGIDIASWKWNFGDPSSGGYNSSTLPDASHKYHSTGSYNVRLTLINEVGCKDSLSKAIKVHALPDAKFISEPACTRYPTQFFDRSMAADTVIGSWLWKFGVPQTNKDTSTLMDPRYAYEKAGHYNVTLVVKDIYGCTDSIDSTLKVNPSPLSAFILLENVKNNSGKIELRNKSEEADTYFWNFGNGLTSTEENPYVTYKEDGTYTIMLISYNDFGCTDTSFYSYELLFKGLYVPNAFVPSSDILGVNQFKPVGINLKNYKIEVFDAWGHKLWGSSALDSDGRPLEGWDGRRSNGEIYQQGTYVWKISASFTDGSTWEGSDIGKGEGKSFGTVTLIR